MHCMPIELQDKDDSLFYCRECCVADFGRFDFAACLGRLKAAFSVGMHSLLMAAHREELLIKSYNGCLPLRQIIDEAQLLTEEGVETYSFSLLDHMGIKDKLPLWITGDGDCLFSAAAFGFFGRASQLLLSELRCRTALELALNAEYYDKTQSELFPIALCDLAKVELLNLLTDKNYVCMTALRCLSSVLGLPITSMFPSVGDDSHSLQLVEYNTEVHPRCSSVATLDTVDLDDNAHSPLTIMWTRADDPPCHSSIWYANHFTLLLDNCFRNVAWKQQGTRLIVNNDAYITARKSSAEESETENAREGEERMSDEERASEEESVTEETRENDVEEMNEEETASEEESTAGAQETQQIRADHLIKSTDEGKSEPTKVPIILKRILETSQVHCSPPTKDMQGNFVVIEPSSQNLDALRQCAGFKITGGTDRYYNEDGEQVNRVKGTFVRATRGRYGKCVKLPDTHKIYKLKKSAYVSTCGAA